MSNEVWRRLLSPRQTISFAELAQIWRGLQVQVRLEGYGAIADHPRLLPDLRGAIGRQFMHGASQASLDGKICDWTPPCAMDVFFGPKPELRVGRHTHVIPKPFVLSARSSGRDLDLSVSLFGFAREWVDDVRSALAGALRDGMDWKKLAASHFLPANLVFKVEIRDMTIGRPLDKAPSRCEIHFVTALDSKNADPLDRPESVISRLASRIILMARWQEVEMDADLHVLSDAWRKLEMDAIDRGFRKVVRDSSRTSSRYTTPGRLIDLEISGDLQELWPILVLGEVTHVGRGTVAGLGRYLLGK